MLKKLTLGLLLISSGSYANIIIQGTRFIYPSGEKGINVQLTNNDNRPSLVQAWMDNGDMKSSPDSIKVPFVITPPVSRVEQHAGQTLRINYTGEPLPADRESVFYLNITDTPPKPRGENKNYLQFAVRSRLKFFYRPQGLKISVQDAYQKVTWQKTTLAGKNALRATNPTPYYITYSAVNAGSDAQQDAMLAPFSSHDFVMKGAVGRQVEWTVINDYGGFQSGKSSIQ
ncbi:Chaperone protein focC precursor [Gallibacterium anatis]|uniref:Chaperone protein focC n=1 Tax=Gallibacterium anatis TaxID=750 RepID=A0A377H8B3_9PAST|nr:fimbria/pilus periplasmic chaperone [Gallibacterium anatis]KGQ51957.1 molecular chaperone [Gallibacterium anatis DSM 16844 = F 149]STO38836.1 Chaperone protein focC precursor [Gallibacterium anatis]